MQSGVAAYQYSKLHNVVLMSDEGEENASIGWNYLFDVNDTRYELTTGGSAMRVLMKSNTMFFEVSNSGAANDVITWYRALTLTQVSGVPHVGIANATTSPSTYCIFPASTTGVSSFRVPHGVAPTSAVNGDVWGVSGESLYYRNNGVTQYASWTKQATVADASGGIVIDEEARTALNSLLAKLRTINIITT